MTWMNTLLPGAIVLGILGLMSSSGLPKLVERFTGRSTRDPDRRYKIATWIVVCGSLLLQDTLIVRWSFLWKFVAICIIFCPLLLLIQGF